MSSMRCFQCKHACRLSWQTLKTCKPKIHMHSSSPLLFLSRIVSRVPAFFHQGSASYSLPMPLPTPPPLPIISILPHSFALPAIFFPFPSLSPTPAFFIPSWLLITSSGFLLSVFLACPGFSYPARDKVALRLPPCTLRRDRTYAATLQSLGKRPLESS